MKGKTQKIKENYFIYLPTNIVDEINKIRTTKTLRDRMFHFVNHLKNSSRKIGSKQNDKGIEGNITNYVPTPKTYLTKAYTGKYNNILSPLLKHQIIEVNNSYSNFKGNEKCKEYRISPKWLNELEITKDCLKSIELERDATPNTHIQSFYKSCVGGDITTDMYNDLEEYLEHLSKLPYQNYVVTDRRLLNIKHIPLVNKKGEIRKFDVDEIFDKYGFIIKDKNKYFLCNSSLFMENKIRNKKLYVIEATKRIVEGDLYAKRNSTNGRMDTNFTNFPSDFFEYYKRRNNLVEFDVKNNQFAILAHILPKHLRETSKDIWLFSFLVENGIIYEYLAQSLKMRNGRDEAKELLISSVFASYKTLDPRIKKVFPDLCEWIKEWKKYNGDNGEFAIMLQKIESDIFIDGLFVKFKKMIGCPLYVKHDAIIVHVSEAEKVKEEMEKHFKEIEYKCKIK